MGLTEDVKYKLTRLNVLEKIIVINSVLFVVGLMLKSNLGWFELPSHFYDFILQPWSIVSYAFLHYAFLHFLFNMLWLYTIGKMFLNIFGPKMALNIYFLGSISGGLLFLLGYNLFPDVFGSNVRLVGASAAIMALLIFLCTYMPNMEIRFFIFNLKLWYIGVAIVIIDVLGLFGLNAGGNLAHLGGVLLGYFYAKQLTKGHDIGKGFETFMDVIVGIFKPIKKKHLKAVHKNKSKVDGYTKADFDAFNNQKKIDIILDKISKSGYESLTKEEKEFLFRAGK